MNPIENVTPDMLDPAVTPVTEAEWNAMSDEERLLTWFYSEALDWLYPPQTMKYLMWTNNEYLTDPRKPEYRGETAAEAPDEERAHAAPIPTISVSVPNVHCHTLNKCRT